MAAINPNDVLKLTRKHLPGSYDAGGSTVEIIETGFYDPSTGLFGDSKICVDGTVRTGAIAIGAEEELIPLDKTDAVLQVSAYPTNTQKNIFGDPVPVVISAPETRAMEIYTRMSESRGYGYCAGIIASMDGYRRTEMFTRLLIDRLERKCRNVMRIYESGGGDWNTAMYGMLMATIGDRSNKDNFCQLALKVPYKYILKERADIRTVEALLIGASGLLENYPRDSYTDALKSDFRYLNHKYGIEPMDGRKWSAGGYPQNNPVLRLAQLAAFLSDSDFIFDRMMRCRTFIDLKEIFRAQASEYWTMHYILGRKSAAMPKRIGEFKCGVLAINFTVPLMFCYGTHCADDTFKEAALDLLELLEAERYKITELWSAGGAE